MTDPIPLVRPRRPNARPRRAEEFQLRLDPDTGCIRASINGVDVVDENDMLAHINIAADGASNLSEQFQILLSPVVHLLRVMEGSDRANVISICDLLGRQLENARKKFPHVRGAGS